MNPNRQKQGFTLIEALVACLVLAGSVVALTGLNTRAIRSLDLAQQYSTAWQILDHQLTTIDYMTIDAFLEHNEMQGQTQRLGQDYHWLVQVESKPIDALYNVQVTVAWNHMGKTHKVTAQTRLNGLLPPAK